MIHYRTFRNSDPPALVEVWNASFTGRGAVLLPGPTLLEYFTLAKPYFDPAGLIVATDEDRVVGFAHAGFGVNEGGSALDTRRGVLCTIGVLPTFRRQGIGTELARRSEDYLRGRGAEQITAGASWPDCPFTFGLYGGSRPGGFLDSDPLARPFVEHLGYRQAYTELVFQRLLDQPVNVADARFPAHRQRYEIYAGPAVRRRWWQECVLGPVELYEYRLVERGTGRLAGWATLWEMETFSRRWNQHAIGIIEVEVMPDCRRQGLARFLLAQILRHVSDQYFNLIEAHAGDDNAAGTALLRGLGFDQIDAGRSFRPEPAVPGE